MARPLRIEFPGAVYHVTSRGNARADIVEDDSDRELILSGPRAGSEAVQLALSRLLPHG